MHTHVSHTPDTNTHTHTHNHTHSNSSHSHNDVVYACALAKTLPRLPQLLPLPLLLWWVTVGIGMC